MRIKPGSKSHRVLSVVAIVWLAGFAGFGIPEGYRQVFDHNSLRPCAEEFLKAKTDRDIAKKHIPQAQDEASMMQAAAYIAAFERAFIARMEKADCPSKVADAKRDMLYRMDLLADYIETIAVNANNYDGFFMGIRLGEVNRSLSAFDTALADLFPKKPVAPQPSPEQTPK